MDNSIKYTSDGYISIILLKEDNTICCTITDNGNRTLPAINPKLVPKLTDSDNKYEAMVIGNDLGLYVAKKYIEGQRGHFSVTQNDDNTTAFAINLPYIL
jgi:signal transduction histidine kinase